MRRLPFGLHGFVRYAFPAVRAMWRGGPCSLRSSLRDRIYDASFAPAGQHGLAFSPSN